MAVFTVRNVPDAVHRTLRARAARHGRSTEAEVREILANAVKPEQRIRLGSPIAEIGRRHRCCPRICHCHARRRTFRGGRLARHQPEGGVIRYANIEHPFSRKLGLAPFSVD